MGPMPVDKNIVDLEVRVAYQERTISQLDEVVCELATRIERLEHQLRELRDRVNAAPDDTPDTPPPHY